MFDTNTFDAEIVTDNSNPVASQPTTQNKTVSEVSTITVLEFRNSHNLTTEDFTNLKRRAKRQYPEQCFEPLKQGSKTYYVRNLALLEAVLSKPSAIVQKDAQSLLDGFLGTCGEIAKLEPKTLGMIQGAIAHVSQNENAISEQQALLDKERAEIEQVRQTLAALKAKNAEQENRQFKTQHKLHLAAQEKLRLEAELEFAQGK